ncbi:MAG: hypothetical protein ISR59_03615 [Anaerolineales bacterium]|uniref:Glycosyltransferase RgtA/B/C/D-like domain-containing protein n=1 Tax=Candidatus Desulfolinea nitratireducens TaxID=2841698 RepID=A0A8J6NGF3_9CHLR|nr:hypothetical protein [Candidatus Desulfolinea nitratireducens]MBL6960172.1 hypothetical protein [Anaerolineales bacterium]
MKENNNLITSKYKFVIAPKYILFFFLIGSLVAGYFLASDYGMSWDIRYQIMMGKYNQEYISLANFLNPPPFELMGHDKYYGPIHEILIQSVSNFFRRYQLEFAELQLYYWINFSSFLLGMFFFYNLARRYMQAWASLLSTFLLFSQPILFGHAFINSKDIPFMAFLMGSIVIGLHMIDRIEPSLGSSVIINNKISKFAILEWKKNNSKRKKIAIIFAWVWSVTVFLTIIFWSFISKLPELVVEQSMRAGSERISGQLFLRFAQNIDIFSLDAYVHKATILFSRFMTRSFLLCFFLLGIIIISLLPKTINQIWNNFLKAYIAEIFSKTFIRETASYLINPWSFLAGIFLGITTSIRIVGPVAAGLVGMVILCRKKEKTLAPLTAYLLIGSAVTYLIWPLLWSTGFSGVIQAIRVMTDFPWKGTVLFNGQFYSGADLPFSYLPALIAIQLTEPVVIGFIIGIPFLIWLKTKKTISAPNFWLLTFWFLFPLIGVMLLHPTIYDNFRQFFFILPPIFIVVGISVDWLFVKINLKWINSMIALAILLPGLLAITTLHPYEYVYYNHFVGGVGGAFRQFEMDYWAISINEATIFINENAITDAKIVVGGPYQNVEYYAREDLKIFDLDKIKDDSLDDYDYAILLTRGNADLEYAIGYPTIFQVEQKGAVFVVVRDLIR